MDFNAIANSFVDHYITTFDGGKDSRKSLAALYRPESMLTWEGTQTQGAENIVTTITKPEISVTKHRISSTDAIPIDGGILIAINGNLAIDNAFDKPLLFSESFFLQPIPGQPGGFFIYGQVFRLLFG